jgi:threonine aldolase
MLIDLRSDTVTRPSEAMRTAMARAEVGDDVFGEDPTVRALEVRTAELLGKEAALFVPSGTMGNQISLLVHTRPGDEVLVSQGAHVAWFESGAGAAIAGVQFLSIGDEGSFSADEVVAAAKPERDFLPRTRLVAVENTHNRAGGRIFPEQKLLGAVAAARKLGLALHLDGARLWNAAIATGRDPAALAEPFDTVNVCFSKGLGAPAGSAIAASRDAIRAARRFRKMLGGGMRQAGILAAGALFALEHYRERLALDHEHARLFADALADIAGVQVPPVETNIVLLHLPTPRADALAEALAKAGVLGAAFGPRTLRFVTHLDVSRAAVLTAAAVTRRVCGESALDRA